MVSALFGKKYFWTYGRTNQGKPVILGPYGSEPEAERMAEKLEDSQVLRLSTKNSQAATRQIKAKLAERPGVVDNVVRRFKHKSTEPTMTPIEEGLIDDDTAIPGTA